MLGSHWLFEKYTNRKIIRPCTLQTKNAINDQYIKKIDDEMENEYPQGIADK